MVDLHGRADGLPALEVDRLANVWIREHARLDFAPTELRVFHAGQIAREHVFAHIAAIAVVVCFAVAEQFAVVARRGDIVIHRQFLQCLRRRTRGMVLPGQFRKSRADARQNDPDGHADHYGNHEQDQHALSHTGTVEVVAAEMLGTSTSHVMYAYAVFPIKSNRSAPSSLRCSECVETFTEMRPISAHRRKQAMIRHILNIDPFDFHAFVIIRLWLYRVLRFLEREHGRI